MTLLIALLTFVGSFALPKYIGFEFVPEADLGEQVVSIEMPIGSSLEYSESKLRQVQAIGVALDGDGANTVLAQALEHQEVARVFHQHGVAGLQKGTADHVDGVGTAKGGEDAARVHRDAHAAQNHGNALAQIGQTLRRAA